MALSSHNEALRSLAFGSISGTYASVGSATTHQAYQITVQNTTDVTLIFSKDGGTTDWVAIPATTSAVFDYAHKTENGQSIPDPAPVPLSFSKRVIISGKR